MANRYQFVLGRYGGVMIDACRSNFYYQPPPPPPPPPPPENPPPLLPLDDDGLVAAAATEAVMAEPRPAAVAPIVDALQASP